MSEKPKKDPKPETHAPAATPAAATSKPDEVSTTEKVVKTAAIGALIATFIGTVSSALSAPEGRKTVGKVVGHTARAIKLAGMELTHEKGELSTALREHRREITEFGNEQKRKHQQENSKRSWQTCLIPLRLFVPVPLWMTSGADDTKPATAAATTPTRPGWIRRQWRRIF